MDGGVLHGPDGHWSAGPPSLQVILDMHEGVLRDIMTSFQYPPRVPSAFSRSWASAAERAVDRARIQLGLERVWFDVVSADEDTDMTDATPGDSTNPRSLT